MQANGSATTEKEIASKRRAGDPEDESKPLLNRDGGLRVTKPKGTDAFTLKSDQKKSGARNVHHLGSGGVRSLSVKKGKGGHQYTTSLREEACFQKPLDRKKRTGDKGYGENLLCEDWKPFSS